MTPFTVAQSDGNNDWSGGNNHLALLMAPASLQMMVSDADNTVVFVAEFHFTSTQGEGLVSQIATILNQYKVTANSFQKVYVSFLNREFTLVPESFYDPSRITSLVTFVTGSEGAIMGGKLPGLHFCYSVDATLLNWCEKEFPQAFFLHAGMVTLSMLLSDESLHGTSMFLVINNGCMELAVAKQGQVVFYNVFHFEVAEDILYYVLFAMEQLSINPLEAQLHIASQLEVTNGLVNDLSKYIRKVSYLQRDKQLKLKVGLHYPEHFFYNLLHQSICAS